MKYLLIVFVVFISACGGGPVDNPDQSAVNYPEVVSNYKPRMK